MGKNTQNKPVRFFGEIQLLTNGRYKVRFMQKLVRVNQSSRRKWKNVDTLNFAKELNSKLITN